MRSSQVHADPVILGTGLCAAAGGGFSSHACAAATWEAERSEAGGVFIYSPLWFFLCCDPNSNSLTASPRDWGGGRGMVHQPQDFFPNFLFFTFFNVSPGRSFLTPLETSSLSHLHETLVRARVLQINTRMMFPSSRHHDPVAECSPPSLCVSAFTRQQQHNVRQANDRPDAHLPSGGTPSLCSSAGNLQCCLSSHTHILYTCI